MHRCDNADSSTTATGAYDASVAVYRDESIGVHDATQLRFEEMNAIQEEICNVIRAEGYTLNTDAEAVASMTQLNTAIDNKLNSDNITDESVWSGGFQNLTDTLDAIDLYLVGLDTTDVSNNSIVPGSLATDALDFLFGNTAGAIYGLDMYENSGNIVVKAGTARNRANDRMLTLASNMTKTTGAWVAGTGNGGFGGDDGGPNNDTWYYIFIIGDGSLAADIGFDNNFDASSLISTSLKTYTRRIGAFYYTGGAVKPFFSYGDHFQWNEAFSETRAISAASGNVLDSTKYFAPPEAHQAIIAGAGNITATGAIYGILHTKESGATLFPTPAAAICDVAHNGSSNYDAVFNKYLLSGSHIADGRLSIKFNTTTSGDVDFYGHGWIDNRERLQEDETS